MQAAGGVAPYQFDFFGYLPEGLQVSSDGAVFGIPTTLAGEAFLVRVNDAQSKQTSAPCSVGVGLPAIPQISITGLPAIAQPAATNIAVTVRLNATYTQPIY